MKSTKLYILAVFYKAMGKKIKLEESENEGDDKRSSKVSITIHAHFQLPLPKLHDPSTLKFKKKDATTSQKKVVPYHRFQTMQDIYVLVKELCYLDIKGGDFDENNPSPIRVLSYVGATNEFLMASEDLKIFPSDYKNLTSNRAIELAVFNMTKVAKKRNFEDLSADVEENNAEGNDHEVVIVKYDPVYLPLRFEFDHGRRVLDDKAIEQVLLTVSGAKFFGYVNVASK